MIVSIYDSRPEDPNIAASIADPELSAYLALVHLVGIRAMKNTDVTLDVRADSPGLRGAGHLEMIGGVICCPELSTRYPAA